MHNLISFNQLASWNQTEKDFKEDKNQLMNDYFECLIECNDDAQTCRRLCKEVLVS